MSLVEIPQCGGLLAHPRCTRPCSTIWAITSRAMLMGTANPIPTLPPTVEKMAVLIPTSSPRRFDDGREPLARFLAQLGQRAGSKRQVGSTSGSRSDVYYSVQFYRFAVKPGQAHNGAHTMMPVQACCICGKASHSYSKKNLYYNIPMFGCLCGSSALLPRSPTRAKNLVK
jgi:hypothetical protein